MSFSFEAIARNVPAILIVGGVFLIAIGSTTGDSGLIDLGMTLARWGVILQVLYLVFKYGPALLAALDRLNR